MVMQTTGSGRTVTAADILFQQGLEKIKKERRQALVRRSFLRRRRINNLKKGA